MSTAEPPDGPGPQVPPPAPDPAPPETPLPDPPGASPGLPASDADAAGPTWSAATGTEPPEPTPPPGPGVPPAPPVPTPPAPAAAPTPPPPPGPAVDTIVPAADAWSAPPPKAKRRLTWLWVLLGVLGLIAALVVVAVVLFVRTLAGPIDATNDVLAQIKAGQAATEERDAAAHYEKAYRLSCAKDREVYTQQQFRQVFEATKAARGPLESYDVNYSSVHGDEADVRYDLQFGRGGERRYEAVAHKEGGKWRACLLTSGD